MDRNRVVFVFQMAIAFARLQIVSRSKGSNACLKSAYNAKTEMTCERTGRVFYFAKSEKPYYHEILLPVGVDVSFQNATVLWNTAERHEKRTDAQVAKEMVLALPCDAIITHQDRIYLCQRFVKEHFVSKGLAVQLDIHGPHTDDKNWHAHLLITTRRFSKDGTNLGEKARDINPTFFKKQIMEGDVWGKAWQMCQDGFFMEKGYDIRVDPNGMISQNHIGPVRMRHHESDLLKTLQERKEANLLLPKNPKNILDHMTRTKAVFCEKDVEAFLKKHVLEKDREALKEEIFKSGHILQLFDKEKDPVLGKYRDYDLFTTRTVRNEEQRMMRYASHIHKKCKSVLSEKVSFIMDEKKLTTEQREAFKHICFSKNGLICIQGRAGTGKSYALSAICDAYKKQKKTVLGLAPTNTVAKDMQTDAGFLKSKTIHKMLFDLKMGKETLKNVDMLVVDEAGMVSHSAMGELLKVCHKNKVKLVLVGDDKQLPSVERGGMFHEFCKTYGVCELKEIKRQHSDYQKKASFDMAQGHVKEAVHSLNNHGNIFFKENTQDAFQALIHGFMTSHHDIHAKLIITHQNAMVGKINKAVHDLLKQEEKIDAQEFECLTIKGNHWEREKFSKGDRIQFTQTDAKNRIFNGIIGTLVDASERKFMIQSDAGDCVSFDPNKFHGFTHGFASTVYKSQGKTKQQVFILHDKMHNHALSYVSLTRHKDDIKLYVAKDVAKDMQTLIHHMRQENGNFSSLAYKTHEDIVKEQEAKHRQTFISTLKTIAHHLFERVRDRFSKNHEFYKPSQNTSAEINIEHIYERNMRSHVSAVSIEKPLFMDTHVKTIELAQQRGCDKIKEIAHKKEKEHYMSL